MDINRAIETLRKLPPERQEHVVTVIEEEAVRDDRRLPEFLQFLLDNPIDGWPSDLSENRAKFTGRGEGL